LFGCAEHGRERGSRTESRAAAAAAAAAAVVASPAGQEKRGVGRMFDLDATAVRTSQTVQTHQVRRAVTVRFLRTTCDNCHALILQDQAPDQTRVVHKPVSEKPEHRADFRDRGRDVSDELRRRRVRHQERRSG